MGAWEENVRRVTPYVPGEQPQNKDIIKLNTNENPYPPPFYIRSCLENEYDFETMRLYPDPSARILTGAIADYFEISRSQVFVGIGSDDVLAMAFQTFFNSDKPLLFPDITYSFYEVWAELFGIPYKKIPLNRDFMLEVKDYACENGGIIFPNPNAPTGIELDSENVEWLIRQNPDSVVIVDEAYVDFGAKSALQLVEKYDNLLVVQTFSKSRSLAGARIGYAIGNEKLIGYMNDVRFSFNSYTISTMTALIGRKSLEAEKEFRRNLLRIINTREQTSEELKKLGFSLTDSKSNFLFASHKDMPAKVLFEKLKQENIYVRYFDKPRIDNYLRITVGTDEQMNVFLDTVKRILKKES